MTNIRPKNLAADYRRVAEEASLKAASATDLDVLKVYLRTAELWNQRAAREESKVAPYSN
jgi:hypothetical protein